MSHGYHWNLNSPVEISYVGGALVCIVKTSCAEYRSRADEPPMPVTDMPPAHADVLLLYWMSEQG